MNIGPLDQRITIQARTAGVDALGQAATTWDNVVTVWAAADPIRGREYFAAATQQSETAVRFTVRYRSDVTPAMRVMWRNQAHDISAVIDPHGRKESLELMCLAGVADGR
jgi:SPP1 family predicted phage head-tail adaptor